MRLWQAGLRFAGRFERFFLEKRKKNLTHLAARPVLIHNVCNILGRRLALVLALIKGAKRMNKGVKETVRPGRGVH